MIEVRFFERVINLIESKSYMKHEDVPEIKDIYPAKSGILQSPSCVCLFVCLLAGFLINHWSDFDEIWRVGR